MPEQAHAVGCGEDLPFLFGREAGEDDVHGHLVLDGDDDAEAGAGEPASAIKHLGEHSVEVEARIAFQDGGVERGDALLQRLVLACHGPVLHACSCRARFRTAYSW